MSAICYNPSCARDAEPDDMWCAKHRRAIDAASHVSPSAGAGSPSSGVVGKVPKSDPGTPAPRTAREVAHELAESRGNACLSSLFPLEYEHTKECDRSTGHLEQFAAAIIEQCARAVFDLRHNTGNALDAVYDLAISDAAAACRALSSTPTDKGSETPHDP